MNILDIAIDGLEYIRDEYECTCTPETIEEDPCPSCMATKILNEINQEVI